QKWQRKIVAGGRIFEMVGCDQAREGFAAYFFLGVDRIEKFGGSAFKVLALNIIIETLCPLPRHVHVTIFQDTDETLVEEHIQRFRNEHIPKTGSWCKNTLLVVLCWLAVSTCC